MVRNYVHMEKPFCYVWSKITGYKGYQVIFSFIWNQEEPTHIFLQASQFSNQAPCSRGSKGIHDDSIKYANTTTGLQDYWEIPWWHFITSWQIVWGRAWKIYTRTCSKVREGNWQLILPWRKEMKGRTSGSTPLPYPVPNDPAIKTTLTDFHQG